MTKRSMLHCLHRVCSGIIWAPAPLNLSGTCSHAKKFNTTGGESHLAPNNNNAHSSHDVWTHTYIHVCMCVCVCVCVCLCVCMYAFQRETHTHKHKHTHTHIPVRLGYNEREERIAASSGHFCTDRTSLRPSTTARRCMIRLYMCT